MSGVRYFFRTHRALSLATIVLALAIKALIPAGMMIAPRGDLMLTVVVCSGMGAVETVIIPIERESGPAEKDRSAADSPACGFTALGQATLTGADGVLLALALFFILLVGLAPEIVCPVPAASYRWPPMRGPPLTV